MIASTTKHLATACQRTGRLFERIISWSAFLLLFATCCASLFITAFLPEYNYTIHFSTSGAVATIVIVLVLIALFLVLSRFQIINHINSRKLSLVVFLYTVVAGLIWIALANTWPEWDSYDIFLAAKRIGDTGFVLDCSSSQPETWVLCPGGYFERFPYQIPILIFVRKLIWIFGDSAYLAFEFCNVFAAAILFVLIGKIAQETFCDLAVTNVSLLLCAVFFPQIFYVTFAYGNTLSMPFVASALLFQVRYFQNKKYKFALLSSFFIAIAILFKSTNVYVLLAMIVTWLISALKNKSFNEIISVFIAVLLYVCATFSIPCMAQHLGFEKNIGEPKTVWIAMGLQKPANSNTNNYGWYNGYPASFPGATYDKSKISKESVESIRHSIKDFIDNPRYAATFFGKKYASEWLEPTYESLLASNWSHGRQDRPAMSSRNMSHFQHSIYYGKINKALLYFLDGLQSFMLLGAAMSLWFKRKSLSISQLTIPVIIFGMALLYLLWEAQSQYILPAYLLMLPFSASGTMEIVRRLPLIKKRK